MKSVWKDGMVRHKMVPSIKHNRFLIQARLTLLMEWMNSNQYFDKTNCEDFQKDGSKRMCLKHRGFAHVLEVLSVLLLADIKEV